MTTNNDKEANCSESDLSGLLYLPLQRKEPRQWITQCTY